MLVDSGATTLGKVIGRNGDASRRAVALHRQVILPGGRPAAARRYGAGRADAVQCPCPGRDRARRVDPGDARGHRRAREAARPRGQGLCLVERGGRGDPAAAGPCLGGGPPRLLPARDAQIRLGVRGGARRFDVLCGPRRRAGQGRHLDRARQRDLAPAGGGRAGDAGRRAGGRARLPADARRPAGHRLGHRDHGRKLLDRASARPGRASCWW